MRKIVLLLTLLGICGYSSGQISEMRSDIEEVDASVKEVEITPDDIIVKLDSSKRLINDRFAISVQLGTDIGGALPIPLKYVPKKFQPYPKMTASLGAKVIFPIYKEWSLGVEATYKKIMMDADARVDDQRFKKYATTPGDLDIIAAFTGTAEMNMDFTMLEMPLYASYTFKNFKDRILFGPYFAWMIDNKFNILAKKGYVTDADGKYDAEIKPEDNFVIDFSQSLSDFDWGVMVGYERALTERIDLGLRVMVGAKDIFKSTDQYLDYNMNHMRGTVVLSYALVNIRSKKNILGHTLKELN